MAHVLALTLRVHAGNLAACAEGRAAVSAVGGTGAIVSVLQRAEVSSGVRPLPTPPSTPGPIPALSRLSVGWVASAWLPRLGAVTEAANWRHGGKILNDKQVREPILCCRWMCACVRARIEVSASPLGDVGLARTEGDRGG